ncbi:MAG: B12-binding domain-containing radical SAM protein [Candidatus Caldatribacteriota bacterium]|nr:B12-binding domain-containing radical SAM protein [Candidatus Caldatribacteriota bacterium]
MKKNTNLDILLINPWIYDFTAYDFWSKPLGLLYIASILREQNYRINYIDCLDRYNSSILKLTRKKPLKKDEFGRGHFYKEEIDKPEILKSIPRRFNRYGITEDIFLKEIKKIPRPRVILITSIMTYWYPGVFRAIEMVKELFPKTPVILGGVYSTLCYGHASKLSGADYVIKGSNIKSLLQILEEITGNKGNNYSKYDKKLDYLPYPAWNLYEKLDYICILSSRGCPFRCSYCASHKINPKLEFRNPIQVAEEIKYWSRRRKIKDFVFYDDALLIKPEDSFIVILNELINKKVKIRLHMPNGIHARIINEEIAYKMYQSGVETIRLGFETVDPLVQETTGGKITNQEFKRAVNYLLKAGFKSSQIGAYLLIGLPGQKIQGIRDSIRFVVDCGAHPRLAKFSAIPGTKIWDQAKNYFEFHGEVDPLFHNDALLPYISPDITERTYSKIKSIIKIQKEHV